MSTYLMLEFYAWHGLAIVSICACAFFAGYYTAIRRFNSEQ